MIFSRFFTTTACATAVLCAVSYIAKAAPDSDSGSSNSGQDVVIKASDDKSVYGTFTPAKPDNDKILLLFHQAGANHHEYDPLIATFNQAGFDTLAIDQRSGGERWGLGNKTVMERGSSGSYQQAYPDLEGALDWAQSENYTAIVTVGSSYSAALSIVLAAEHPEVITAIACFSAGEYLDDKNKIKEAAAKIKIPFYATAEPDIGEQRVDDVLSDFHGDNLTRYSPDEAVHGASMLVQERDPKGYQKNLEHLMSFLNSAL